MSGEVWKPISGQEGRYEVSSLGRIRSLDRQTIRSDGQVRNYKGKYLQTKEPNSHGYITVRMDGKNLFVHRLVAEAFLPNPNNLPNILHWDDNPLNNKVTNLRWGTQKENIEDILRNKNHFQKNQTHCYKGHELTKENTYTRKGSTSRWCRKCGVQRTIKWRKKNSTEG